MKIAEFLSPNAVISDLHATSKPDVLSELSASLARSQPSLRQERLVEVLKEREKLGSTGIGEGVAIPHGKLDAVGKLVSCVGRAPDGVDFDSMDGRPTHLFFVLVAPENSTGVHLKALARISRLFKDPEFRTRLMRAKDAPELYRVIADEDAKY